MEVKSYIVPILLFAAFCSIGTFGLSAQRGKQGKQKPQDSLRIVTIRRDSTKKDSVRLDTVKKKRTQLDAPVDYKANDSIVFEQNNQAYLYGSSEVDYQKIKLNAERIVMKMDSSTVEAVGRKDSVGKMIGEPVFTDGDAPYQSKTMRYNFKSKRGFITDVTTQQGEGYVTSFNSKKGADGLLYMHNGRYTTCDKHDDPDFYLALTYAKVRPKKNIVFGPAYLVVAGVPLPIAVPFGFFPFTDHYSSGVVMPTYGDELDRGFYLRDGGYYWAINDYMDLKLTGEIFTKGSWGLGLASNYRRKYKYSGNINLSYITTKTGDKGLPDYAVSKDFKVVWSHTQDSKANPNQTFSASVNYATSSYEKSSLTSQYNPLLYSQSTKTSSVSYTRSFPNQNLTVSNTMNLSQSTRDSTVSVSFPNVTVSLASIYPFRRKEVVGNERWYEKIRLSYTGTLSNSIDTKENMLFKSNLFKDWNNGMEHKIPVSATFSLLKYINLTPSFNYTERWYSNKILQSWDYTKDAVKKDTIYGFNRVYNYDFSVSASTKLYGMYTPMFHLFGIKQIRHVFSPSVSFSTAPDFGNSHYGYWKTYTYTDTNGDVQTTSYSPFASSLYGYPSNGKTGTISFSVDNNVEAKVTSSKDSTGVVKKSIIDDLSLGMSYNLSAETKPWSDLSMSLRLKFTKSYTLNISTSFATYAYQFKKDGKTVEVGDRTEWSYGRFGRFQGCSFSYSYTLNNSTWKKLLGQGDDKNKEKKKPENPSLKADDQNNDPQQQPQNNTPKEVTPNTNEYGYLPFKMPWSMSLSWSCRIAENTSATINPKNMRYPYKLTQTLSASGNLSLSDKWKMNFTTSYDFNAHQIATTSINVSRDLHCFTMTCGLVPFGTYKSYNFSISANSSLLQDLKYRQQNVASSNIKWY